MERRGKKKFRQTNKQKIKEISLLRGGKSFSLFGLQQSKTKLNLCLILYWQYHHVAFICLGIRNKAFVTSRKDRRKSSQPFDCWPTVNLIQLRKAFPINISPFVGVFGSIIRLFSLLYLGVITTMTMLFLGFSASWDRRRKPPQSIRWLWGFAWQPISGLSHKFSSFFLILAGLWRWRTFWTFDFSQLFSNFLRTLSN